MPILSVSVPKRNKDGLDRKGTCSKPYSKHSWVIVRAGYLDPLR